jgi:hypothetical protein
MTNPSPSPTTPTLFVRADDYSPAVSWHLLDWCLSRGADEFSLAFLGPPYLPETSWADVDMLLAPFRRHVASAGDRWALTGESAAVLRTVLPHGLFTYDAAASSLQDPTIYRGRLALLSIVTREGEGMLRLGADDRASFERTGLPFHRERRSPA